MMRSDVIDIMVELWLKIMQIGCLTLKAHSRILCRPHTKILPPLV